jgi:glycosyltransferase 2 family protein
MNKKTGKLFLKVLVSLGFLAWLIFRVNWIEVLFFIKQIKIWQIVLYFIVYIAGVWISSYKWKLLAEFKNIKAPTREFFQLYLTGTFINNFFPSFIGGDTYRAYQLGKAHSNKYIEAASTVMVDRITGFVGVMVLVLLFSIINIKTVIANPAIIIADILIIVSFGSDIVLAAIRKTPIWKAVERFVPQIMIKVAVEMKEYSSRYKILIETIFWGAVFNLVGVGIANLILFQAFGISINIWDYLTVVFIISIVSAIPVSINNIGIKEWAYITFFGLFGISGSAMAAVAIVSRFLQMFVSFFALPAYLKGKKVVSEELEKTNLES